MAGICGGKRCFVSNVRNVRCMKSFSSTSCDVIGYMLYKRDPEYTMEISTI